MSEKLFEKRYVELILIIIILLISIFVIFNKLGSSDVYDWDEARYAENALESLKSGDWIVTKWGGYPDLSNGKPPLGRWLIAMSFMMFGVNEFGLRFFSAFFGVGTILIVYFFAREISGKTAGAISSLLLLANPRFVGFHAARTGDFDVPVTFFIMLSLFLFYLYEKNQKKWYIYGTAISSAFAVMIKSVIGLFPLVIISIYLLYFKKLKEYFKKDSLYSLIIFFSITLPWFFMIFLKEPEILKSMFIYHVFQRTTEVLEYHYEKWFFYFKILYENLGLFFTIILIMSLIYMLYMIKRKEKSAFFLTAWVCIIFFMFTLSQTKLSWYIIPAYPGIALIMGISLNDFKNKLKIKKWIFIILFLVMIFPALSLTIQSVQNVHIDADVQAIKNLSSELKSINTTLYISDNIVSGDGRWAIFFYLNNYVSGKVLQYDKIEDLKDNSENYAITFNKTLADIFIKNTNYELVKNSGNLSLFKI